MAAPEHQVVVPYAHRGPWTEEDWLALPDDPRVELVDGALVVNASPRNRHQRLAYRIVAALDAAAPAGWDVLGEPNVRLGRDRALIPDVAIIADADMDALMNDAVNVPLVIEIVSPGNAAMDRILKPRLYAEAGIRWYLRIEHDADGPVGHLHELDGGAYREVGRGTTVALTEPFPVTLDLVALAR